MRSIRLLELWVKPRRAGLHVAVGAGPGADLHRVDDDVEAGREFNRHLGALRSLLLPHVAMDVSEL